MPDPADIRSPRNAGSQQQPAGDLAIFGAVPAAFADAPAIAQPVSGGATGLSARVGPADPSSSETTARIADTGDAGPGGSLSAPALALPAASAGAVIAAPAGAQAAPAAPITAPISSGIATFVPAPTGSGATATEATTAAVPATEAVPVAQPVAEQVAAMPDPTTSLETIRASLATVQEMVENLAGRLPADPAAANDTLAGATELLAEAQATIDATTSNAATLIDSATQNVLDVGTVVAPTIDALIDTATASVADVTTTIADVAATASSSVAALTETLGNLGPVTQAVGAVDTTVDALGGTDPVAGITTLVGMVSAADAFSLHDSGGPIDDFVPALGALGAADVLADIVPSDVLLGVTDDDHGLIGDLGIDDDNGLFGL